MHRAFCLARTYLLYGSAAFASYSTDTLFATLRRNAEALAVAVRQTLRTGIAQWPHRNDSTPIAVDWNSTDIMFKVAQALGELLLKAYRDSNFPASDSIRRKTRCMEMKNATTAHTEALALQVLSFNVLYDVYRAAGEARDRRLVGFEKLTPAQLFFVAACYARCPGGAHVSNSPALPLTDAPYEPDCDDLLQRTAQFANAFECDQQDSTKAGDECELSPV
ncbi:uncharacterized protein LOC142817416 isoform X2 [Rhipicephalus microplus]|uniref:uncharacterized protein LOC142817416 isoform X2 n=1 Tax=Rhipicephalus microplus TaxID=6941 RepID=UPI003F6B13DA